MDVVNGITIGTRRTPSIQHQPQCPSLSVSVAYQVSSSIIRIMECGLAGGWLIMSAIIGCSLMDNTEWRQSSAMKVERKSCKAVDRVRMVPE